MPRWLRLLLLVRREIYRPPDLSNMGAEVLRTVAAGPILGLPGMMPAGVGLMAGTLIEGKATNQRSL